MKMEALKGCHKCSCEGLPETASPFWKRIAGLYAQMWLEGRNVAPSSATYCLEYISNWQYYMAQRGTPDPEIRAVSAVGGYKVLFLLVFSVFDTVGEFNLGSFWWDTLPVCLELAE